MSDFQSFLYCFLFKEKENAFDSDRHSLDKTLIGIISSSGQYVLSSLVSIIFKNKKDKEKNKFFRGGRCWREERAETNLPFMKKVLNEVSLSADVPSSKLLFQNN